VRRSPSTLILVGLVVAAEITVETVFSMAAVAPEVCPDKVITSDVATDDVTFGCISFGCLVSTANTLQTQLCTAALSFIAFVMLCSDIETHD